MASTTANPTAASPPPPPPSPSSSSSPSSSASVLETVISASLVDPDEAYDHLHTTLGSQPSPEVTDALAALVYLEDYLSEHRPSTPPHSMDWWLPYELLLMFDELFGAVPIFQHLPDFYDRYLAVNFLEFYGYPSPFTAAFIDTVFDSIDSVCTPFQAQGSNQGSAEALSQPNLFTLSHSIALLFALASSSRHRHHSPFATLSRTRIMGLLYNVEDPSYATALHADFSTCLPSHDLSIFAPASLHADPQSITVSAAGVVAHCTSLSAPFPGLALRLLSGPDWETRVMPHTLLHLLASRVPPEQLTSLALELLADANSPDSPFDVEVILANHYFCRAVATLPFPDQVLILPAITLLCEEPTLFWAHFRSLDLDISVDDLPDLARRTEFTLPQLADLLASTPNAAPGSQPDHEPSESSYNS